MEKEVSVDQKDYTEAELEKLAASASSAKGSDIDFARHLLSNGGLTKQNPLEDVPMEVLVRRAAEFADEHGMSEDRLLFIKGAVLAKTGRTSHLTEEEAHAVELETTHKWKQPRTLYWLAVMCAMCAVVQGMDETVINGAQVYFFREWNTQSLPNSQWIQGLVVGAPYLCSAVIGSAITGPLNDLLGRRGVIFLSCLIAGLASIWEAFTYSWVQMFLARLLLGLGIGPKSGTVPIYSAECSPAPIRGALVMMWQMWTAFGIMLGFAVDVIFIPRTGLSETVAWRIMMGSTVIAPIIVCVQVYMVPESPRFYVRKEKYKEAFQSLCRLRNNKIQAARDLYYMCVTIALCEEANRGRNVLADLFKLGRNRRALYASQIVMFMQQFCGVNVIAYYSSSIFLDSGFSERNALLASLGFGLLNWIFALPAVFTIDTFGRRALTLVTLPFLAICLLFTGFVFWVEDTTVRVGLVALGIYVYTIFYSSGMGPVPFTYSAEAFPLHVRETGMSFGTCTLWGFNFILSLTWPAMVSAFKPQGAFGWYAAWNVAGFLLVFFLLPETKALTLEELDHTFVVPTSQFARHQLRYIPHNFRRHILRQKNLPPKDELYKHR